MCMLVGVCAIPLVLVRAVSVSCVVSLMMRGLRGERGPALDGRSLGGVSRFT